VLDDPGFPAARERMWTAVLTGERYRENRVAVAEWDDELAGIAMSGPPEDATAAWTRQPPAPPEPLLSAAGMRDHGSSGTGGPR
jgi:hypothetical protein